MKINARCECEHRVPAPVLRAGRWPRFLPRAAGRQATWNIAVHRLWLFSFRLARLDQAIPRGRAMALGAQSTPAIQPADPLSVHGANSSTPLGTRKHLNPNTPLSHSGRSSAAFPGTTPPQKPTSTQSFPAVAASFSRNPAAVVVAGMLLSGISMRVVIPPAAAARVAVEKPSQSVRPGSLM